MSDINPDYFKPIQKSDTPIADAMAKMVNQQLERLGLDERIDVKEEKKPSGDRPINDIGTLI